MITYNTLQLISEGTSKLPRLHILLDVVLQLTSVLVILL